MPTRAIDIAQSLTAQPPDHQREIARRVGQLLQSSVNPADQEAAIALARQLARAAIETVRIELAAAVKTSRVLPKDVAHAIARDVDAAAVPFLKVTEVFSDAELIELAAALSEAGRAALAARPHVSAALAQRLARIGEVQTAEVLAANEGADITSETAHALCQRFHGDIRILAAFADRPALPVELVNRLLLAITEATRRRLADQGSGRDFTEPVIRKAEIMTMLKLIGQSPEAGLIAHIQALVERAVIDAAFLALALRNGYLTVFEATIAALCRRSLTETRALLRSASQDQVARVFARAKVPLSLHADYQAAVRAAQRPAPGG